MIKKYKKKPIVVEAVQFVLTTESLREVEDFVGGDIGGPAHNLVVATLEGPLHISPNDWVIKGLRGEFYPCRDDIFKATYDPAD